MTFKIDVCFNRTHQPGSLLAIAIVAVLMSFSARLQAQVTIEKIVDTNTQAPGQAFNFNGISRPQVDGNDLIFTGSRTGPSEPNFVGMYRYRNGVITKLVDTSELPNTTDDAFISNVAVNNGVYLFSGSVSLSDERLYKYENSTLTEIAGPADSDIFRNVSLNDDGSATFAGGGSRTNPEGVFRIDTMGNLTTIANGSTAIPNGTGTFEGNTFQINLDNELGKVAFIGQGSGGQQGLYTNRNGVLEKVYDLTDLVPGTTDLYEGFGTPTVNKAGDIAFLGGISTRFGMYKSDAAGGFEVVVDTDTEAPNGVDFVTFGVMELEGENAVFLANTTDFNAPLALYSKTSAGYEELLAVGDMLDGKVITLIANPGGLVNGAFQVNVRFEDDSIGAYRISGISAVPEPCSTILVGLMGVGLMVRRKRS